MAKLSCGCEIIPGGKVTPGQLREHYSHTLETMLFWELVLKSPREDMAAGMVKGLALSAARGTYQRSLEKLFPEVTQDADIQRG